VSKPRAKSSAAPRSKVVQISLAIGLVAAGALAAYGFSRPDVNPVRQSPPVVESPADGQAPADDADTRGTADIALPPVPVSTTIAP
jgi:hypothetical protein